MADGVQTLCGNTGSDAALANGELIVGFVDAVINEAKTAPVGFVASVAALLAILWGAVFRKRITASTIDEMLPKSTLMPVAVALFWTGTMAALWVSVLKYSGAFGFTLFFAIPIFVWWIVDRALSTEVQRNLIDVFVPSGLSASIFIGIVLDVFGRSMEAELNSGSSDYVQTFLFFTMFLLGAGAFYIYCHVKSAEKRQGEKF